MSFLAPLMLAVAGVLAPLIVLMYLLKLKRAPHVVPSTLLWRRSVQDLVANAPFQKLRNNLLLWLQLLILLILCLALARPVMRLAGFGGETIVLLIDLSASMQTVEADGESRLDKAKELANEAIDSMSVPNPLFGSFTGRDEMMIIGFADKTIPIQGLTSDRAALRAAVDSLEALDTETNLEDAGLILQERTMVRVEDRMEPDPKARTILISDGGIGPTQNALSEVANIDFIAVGEEVNNLGFTSVEVRESFSGDFEYQVFANIYNSGPEPADATVELMVNDEVIDLKSQEIPARSGGPVVFTVAENLVGLGTLRLVDWGDGFALDNEIRVNIAPPTEIEVLLVSTGNIFIEKAFNADQRTRISQIAPSDFSQREGYDIVIFDRCGPEVIPDELLPGNYVFVDCLPPANLGYGTAGDLVERPQVIDWSRVHPLTRLADFETLQVQHTRNFTYPEQALPLVQALETDLIVYQETDTVRLVTIGFDIMYSYWPVDTSYLFFVLNLIDHWSRTGRGLEQPAYATGEVVPMVPPRDAARLTVDTPANTQVAFDLEGQTTVYLTETSKAGIYTVTAGEETPRRIPVNLNSVLESDIAPVDELTIGGEVLASSRGSVQTRQELWPWLVLLGLGILMAEWAIYCRRTFM